MKKPAKPANTGSENSPKSKAQGPKSEKAVPAKAGASQRDGRVRAQRAEESFPNTTPAPSVAPLDAARPAFAQEQFRPGKTAQRAVPIPGARYRNGKIARLPVAILEMLNRNLAQGLSGPKLLSWLNRLPETHAMLKLHFKGQRISQQNLSQWRQGGFRDWLIKEEAREELRGFVNDHQELAGLQLPEKLALWVAARHVAMAKYLEQLPPEESWPLVRQVCRDVATLRMGDHRIREQRFKEQEKHKITEQDHLDWAMEPGRLEGLCREAEESEERGDQRTRELGYIIFGDLFGNKPEDLASEAKKRGLTVEELKAEKLAMSPWLADKLAAADAEVQSPKSEVQSLEPEGKAPKSEQAAAGADVQSPRSKVQSQDGGGELRQGGGGSDERREGEAAAGHPPSPKSSGAASRPALRQSEGKTRENKLEQSKTKCEGEGGKDREGAEETGSRTRTSTKEEVPPKAAETSAYAQKQLRRDEPNTNNQAPKNGENEVQTPTPINREQASKVQSRGGHDTTASETANEWCCKESNAVGGEDVAATGDGRTPGKMSGSSPAGAGDGEQTGAVGGGEAGEWPPAVRGIVREAPRRPIMWQFRCYCGAKGRMAAEECPNCRLRWEKKMPVCPCHKCVEEKPES